MKLIDLEAPYKVEIELNGHKCSISVIGKLVDAVPVVRCKDCRFYRFYDGIVGKGWMCFENNTARHGDDYCSRGERKENV